MAKLGSKAAICLSALIKGAHKLSIMDIVFFANTRQVFSPQKQNQLNNEKL